MARCQTGSGTMPWAIVLKQRDRLDLDYLRETASQNGLLQLLERLLSDGGGRLTRDV